MRQKASELRLGNFLLSAPAGHILFRLLPVEPYRDLMIGLLARDLARKYPGETLLDVGANIGDTAAIMATYSTSPMVLVEPSDFYTTFLKENASGFPNCTTIHKCLVSANASERGVLTHVGGTAKFERLVAGPAVECKPLAEIAGDRPRLIKIDTDGFDLSIIAASLDFLAAKHPCLVFENDPYDAETLSMANQVVTDLAGAGYRYFVIFDSAGRHVLSTSELSAVLDLNRFWHKRLTAPDAGHCFEQNVVCIPEADQDVFDSLTEYYRSY
jgi:FkbM family methyltransferase